MQRGGASPFSLPLHAKQSMELAAQAVEDSLTGRKVAMSTIYTTNEWKGHGKQNYYWNEYRLEGDTVCKYKCHRQKFFNGDESEWSRDEDLVESWDKCSPDLPDWLLQYL